MHLLSVRRLPYMARRNFVVELRYLCLWGLFAGLLEGTVSAVVVSKTFGGSDWLITVVQATPAFANLSSLLWGALLVGRRKLPVFMGLAAACIAVSLSVGATPHSSAGGWIFALQIALSRVFISGVVNAQAALWKRNYPKTHRGRITAALQLVRTLMSLPVILGGGLLFDWDDSAYRWFYPAMACLGAASLLVFRAIHVRGEKAALAKNDTEGADGDAGLSEVFEMRDLISPQQILGRMREVLRQDPRFAKYCTAQMCIGIGNLMILPVNAIILTKVLNLTYTASNSLLDVIPRGVILVMLPFWARLFDRVGVVRFRVFSSICCCGSLALGGLGAFFAHYAQQPGSGAYLAAMATYSIGRVLEGMALSGGAIAWYIGHLHFAEDEKSDLYMGIHVSLTGLRGLFAPFVGTLLYVFVGWAVFLVALGISFLGLMTFHRLASEERRGDAAR